jgi:rhodanese-related sulfurtransferase
MLRKLFHADSSMREMTATQLAEAVRATQDLQIVDVREPGEWRDGHIAGAAHIPLGDLGARHAELDPQRPIVMVCRSGNRSAHATRALITAGYADVANLTGGMLAWARAGLPVER